MLQLVVTADLMRRHSAATEGDLAWMRQGIVSRETCARVARNAELPRRMLELAPPGVSSADVDGNESVAAALAEAVIGGAYLDLPFSEVEGGVLAAFAGAVIGSAVFHTFSAMGAGMVGAVVGTLGGAALRSRLAAVNNGNDRPGAFGEDILAVGGGFLVVFLASLV